MTLMQKFTGTHSHQRLRDPRTFCSQSRIPYHFSIYYYYYYYYYFVICFYLLFSLWKRFLKLAASQLSFNCTLLVAFQPHIQLYTFLFIENILPLLPNLHRVYKKKYESTSFPLSNGFAHTLKTRLSIDANCTVMTVLPGRK